jgi:hypothetical protein
MPLFRRSVVRLLIVAWALYTALAQPGLPACWLERIPCESHPHFSPEQAGHPHSHLYLLDLVGSSVAPGLAALITPLSLLIEIFLAGQLLLIFETSSPRLGHLWKALPEPPPPRLAASF